ncbi:unnamed protein product, partial [Rotaria sp. Silwood2]
PIQPTIGNRNYDDQRDLESKLFQWQCPRCTFLNADSSGTCEMCSCEKSS